MQARMGAVCSPASIWSLLKPAVAVPRHCAICCSIGSMQPASGSARRNAQRAIMFLIRGTQAVADAGLGEDVVRPLVIGLDLLPELAHVHAQILRVREIV